MAVSLAWCASDRRLHKLTQVNLSVPVALEMVLEATDEAILPFLWRSVALGFALRYPNPWSPHVATSDILERHLDAETGRLRTTRLLLKRGSLPRWAPRGIMERAESWVIEETEVNVWTGKILSVNRNIDHTTVMEVVEAQVCRRWEVDRDKGKARQMEDDDEGPIGGEVTKVWNKVRVTSSWGIPMLRRRIEAFGVSRFQRQVHKSRMGVALAISISAPGSQYREALLDGKAFDRPMGVTERITVRWQESKEKARERLDQLRRKAKRRRHELGERWLGGASHADGSSPDRDSSQGEQRMDDDMTAEEEAELAHLEKEHCDVERDTQHCEGRDNSDCTGSQDDQPRRGWGSWWSRQ